ncbi:MAG: hypothetical protein P4L35_16230 [Ignavibacteriaceae bacterium]|nr:hypothetical protein [Ignavibacteriaceae bacterium]
MNNDDLYSQFEKYLTDQKFNYKSDAEVEIDKLLKDAQSKKLEEGLLTDIKKVKTQLEKIDNSELRIYKNEIVRELKNELASRYMGNEGRIKESLNNDLQVQTALKIINNTPVYKKLLNLN